MKRLGGVLRPLPAWVRLALAVAAIGGGVVLMLHTFTSLAAIIWLLAGALAVSGVVEFVRGTADDEHRPMRVALGAMWIIAAILVLTVPAITIRVIVLIVGIGLIVHGAVQVANAGRYSISDAGSRVSASLFGISRITVGVLALVWPDVTVIVVAALFGVQLIVLGVDLALGVWRGRDIRHAKAGAAHAWPDSVESVASGESPAPDEPGRGGINAGYRERVSSEKASAPRMPGSKRRTGFKIVAAVAAVAASGALLAVSSKLQTSPIPDAFYTAPAELPAEPGVLLRAEPFDRAIPGDASAWRILYTTTRDDDTPAIASAIVTVPEATTLAPVIAWAHGTTGYATGCAPSLLDEPFVAGGMPIRAFDEAIDAGWAVVATDYTGLGTAGNHPYLIGQGEGRSVIDSVRAARQLDQVALADETVVWGHSQGGHAALWAGGLAASYAPELDLAGVAAMAPASDLPEFLSAVSSSLIGGVFGSFVLAAYEAEYPDVRAPDYVRPGARIALGEMSLRCLTDPATLVSVATTLSSYHPVWLGDPTHGPLLERARENVPTLPIAAPVLIAQGESDDLVLPDLQRSYVEARCTDGWALDYRTYAGRDHMGVVADESPLIDELMTWTADRFASVAVPDACTLATSSTP